MGGSFGNLCAFVPPAPRELSIHSIIIIIFDNYRLCQYIIPSMLAPKITQVMVAGCGPVGLTLANCLARSPFIDSITVLDRKIPSHQRPLPPLANQRVYSINAPSLKLFENLKVLPAIRQKGIMSRIQVVSKQSLSFVNWSENNANIIENDELVASLTHSLKSQEFANKVHFVEDEVESIEIKPQFCQVNFKKQTNSAVNSKLIVGSDGINSNIKQLAGISHYGWNYRQKAIVCTMKIAAPCDNTAAYQIYHDGNVLAILPLWQNYVSLVWSLGLPDFDYLMKQSDEVFRSKLNNVIRNSNRQVGSKPGYETIPQIIEILNKRLSFPLSTMQSSSYTKERIALVGDAAHTIHPMAGLGVNSGFMDSLLLANNVIKNLKTGNDIGDWIALSEYQSKAKAFNYANSLAMEGIKKTFETDYWIVNQARQQGMGLAQSSIFLKQAMKEAVDGKTLQYQWDLAV